MQPLRKCIKCGLEANKKEDLEFFLHDKNCWFERRNECKICRRKTRLPKYPKRTLAFYAKGVCKDCGTPLITDENWKGYNKQNNNYQCQNCYLKYRKDYYKNNKPQYRKNEQLRRKLHPETDRDRDREYQRQHIIGTYINGKHVHLKANKRPYAQTCELCGISGKGLRAYHHWNHDKPDNGMWLCVHCHIFANKLEKGLDKKYFELKAKINGGDLELLGRD